MSLTQAAFDRFLQHINPRADDLARANERVRMVRDRINRTMPVLENPGKPNQSERFPDEPHIWLDNDASLPAPVWVIGKTIMGSAARQTLLNPIMDVDIMLLLQCANPATLVSWTPKGLLDNLRQTLTGIGAEVAVWEGECVTVKFADTPYCDVFPAFNMYNRSTYLFPKMCNQWFKTNPVILDRLVTYTDAKFGGWLRPFIKLLKRWNQLHSVGLKSFHLEALTTRYPREDRVMPRWLHSFFLPAKQHGASYLKMASPDGAVDDMSQYLTETEKQAVIEKMIYAEELCRLANAALRRNDDVTAISFYRRLLGEDFAA